MTTDLTERIERFYKLGERDQENTLAEILQIANENPQQFVQDLYAEEFNGANKLPIIYEALSKDLNNWSDFFLTEIKRLLSEASKSESPNKILNHLNEFAFINPDQFIHRNEFVNILKGALDHELPIFRYYAIYLLPDFIKNDDVATIRKLKEHLKDPDWRIRYSTHSALRDLNKLDNNETLSFADKIKVKLKDPFNFD